MADSESRMPVPGSPLMTSGCLSIVASAYRSIGNGGISPRTLNVPGRPLKLLTTATVCNITDLPSGCMATLNTFACSRGCKRGVSGQHCTRRESEVQGVKVVVFKLLFLGSHHIRAAVHRAMQKPWQKMQYLQAAQLIKIEGLLTLYRQGVNMEK